jgi:hypothetical protein
MRDSTANKEIQRLLNKAEAEFEKAAKVTERRLLQAYRQALDSIKAKIAAVYEGNPTPTLTEMRKFNRLTKIEDQIVEEIRKLTQVSANVTAKSIKDTFLQSYTDTGEAFVLGTGLDISISALPKAAIEYAVSDNLWLDSLKQTNAKLITDAKREFETVLRTNARQEVVQGLAQGDAYGTVAKAITERFNVAATRATTISFTEMHKAQSKGRVEGILKGADAADELGFKTAKVWRHNMVGEPRPGHLAADGQKVAVDAPFKIAGAKGGTVEMEAPGLSGLPEEDIACHCSSEFFVEGLD